MENTAHKKLAVLTAALAVCRGILYSVSSGNFKKEDVDAVLETTSI